MVCEMDAVKKAEIRDYKIYVLYEIDHDTYIG